MCRFLVIPQAPELAADLPIAENVLFSSGPNPDYVYAQISIPAVADVGHLSNISASTRRLAGNEEKLNVESVKTDGLRAPVNVIFLRAMEITVDAGEVVTDTLPGIIEFQVKRQWIEESGIRIRNPLHDKVLLISDHEEANPNPNPKIDSFWVNKNLIFKGEQLILTIET